LPIVGDAREMARMLRHQPSTLYRGLSASLLGAAPLSLVYMPTYELCTHTLKSVTANSGGLRPPISQLASVATGVICAAVRVPMSVIKSRVQTGVSRTPLEATTSALRSRGFRGLYVGLKATCVVDVSYALVQFTALEKLRVFGIAMNDGRALNTAQDAAVGLVTGALTATVTEPLDIIRTRIQTQKQFPSAAGGGASVGGTDFGYHGLVDGMRKALQQEGALALWRGLLPKLLLKSVGSSIWYSVYMAVRKHLSP